MNNILQLKGQFDHKRNQSKPGAPTLPHGAVVTSKHLSNLANQLQNLLRFWQKEQTINGALVSVYYRYVVAKSNRIKNLLRKGNIDNNDTVRGSKFFGDNPKQHVITHFVALDAIKKTVERINLSIEVLDEKYKGEISDNDVKSINEDQTKYRHSILAKTTFLQVIVDAFYVDKFTVDQEVEIASASSIVTLFKTDMKTTDLLARIGIDMFDAKVIDETTVRLDPDELKILIEKAPYLIAMKVNDLRDVLPFVEKKCDVSIVQIPSPKNEPIIGVIDTLFCENVYFKDWVVYTRMVDEQIDTTIDDCFHGTAVTSLIVDGPTINPELEDGCGRFRVKHFGVATKGSFSSFTILKAIREIVAKNTKIKIWNLSLGSIVEINQNFISPEAAELDKIQNEYDIVFVVAGTNNKAGDKKEMRIGAPADSINSLVVNAVTTTGKAASYHRIGPVLSFFHKPDISYYGGDDNQKMRVCTPTGEGFVSGTSFAAPWITRKMAYLIHNMGFTREIAKGLLIDSAAGWNRKDDVSHSIGYGVVPKRIESIVQTPEDEIRFIMSGSSDEYETYTYKIPIPIFNEKQPFFARATLCYFPKCSRNQGVDYTSTEMDIHFGRVKEKSGLGLTEIKSINDNRQGNTGFTYYPEENARKLYRKWDNVKLISEEIKDKSRPRLVYGAGLWGISIKTKERLRDKNGNGMPFGVIITLKEMTGRNRISEFVKLCAFRGWIVNTIDIDNKFDIYNVAEEDVSFE